MACLALSGCTDSVSPSDSSQLVKGFTVAGAVVDSAGAPIAFTSVDFRFAGTVLHALTGQPGTFRFANISGSGVLVAYRDGYDVSRTVVTVSGDTTLAPITLARLVVDDRLTIGRVVRASVLASSPPCDPMWDSMAPCRRFLFTAPADGDLVVRVDWQGLPELDITIVRNRTYFGTSLPDGSEAAVAAAALERGQEYEVRVNSYYESQVFDMKADFRAR